MEGCDQLAIEHAKEAFLPQYSVVPIPPPASPIRIAIALEEIEVLECGHEVCHTESGTDLPSNDAIARGYQISMSGTDALAFVPPDFRTAEGELVSFLGFHYLEFRDVDGALLPEVPEIDVCARVSEEALNWVGDIDPSTDAVELAWYRYDPALGAVGGAREAQVRARQRVRARRGRRLRRCAR